VALLEEAACWLVGCGAVVSVDWVPVVGTVLLIAVMDWPAGLGAVVDAVELTIVGNVLLLVAGS